MHQLQTRGRSRVTLGAAALAAAALVLSGCSAGTAEPLPAPAGGAGSVEEGAYPAVVEHVYGETTITEPPKRVVTIGWSSQDAVVALGVVPVAVADNTYGGDADGYLPWFRDRLEEIGGDLPAILKTSDKGEVDFEQMLDLQPDLILAPHSGITEKEYTRLSDIAPTVAFEKEAWSSDWRRMTQTVGDALGRPQAATDLVAQVESDLAGGAAANPEFAGKTFVYGTTLSEGNDQLGVYIPTDPRVGPIEQLGLVLSPGVAANTVPDGGFSQGISLEKLDEIDADLFIAWGDEEDRQRTLTHPLMTAWRPIAENHAVIFTDRSMIMATSAPSVLALPWSIDTVVPQIAEALAR